MPDINFTRRFDKNGNVEYLIGSNPASGNKLLANIFEKTFLSNIKINDVVRIDDIDFDAERLR